MSALDFAARAMARRASAQAPLTFVQLAAARLPATVTRIDSSGHTKPGRGAASYVSDALATPELQGAFPGAVFAGANGRLFRLLGSADGTITPEQLGCPPYAPGTNQQPYIQAALDYAAKVGLAAVKLPQADYELWMPVRTAKVSVDTDYSGHGLVIRGNVSLISQRPEKTKLWYKGRFGGNLLTEYQVFDDDPRYGIDGMIWRGCAVKIAGLKGFIDPPADPRKDLVNVRLENLILHSDARPDPAMPIHQRLAWPCTTNAPFGWDISNRGIEFEPDQQQAMLHVENVQIIGFLGENLYTNGTNNGVPTADHGVVVRNLTTMHTNGQSLNPNGLHIFDVDGLYAENCAMSLEGWLGWRYGRIKNAYFLNCGPGGVSGSNIYGGPLRPDGSLPFAELDLTLVDCDYFTPGVMTRGRIDAIDTRILCFSTHNQVPFRHINLDIKVTCHKRSLWAAFAIQAHADLQTASGEPLPENTTDIHVRLGVFRTEEAIAAGHVIAPVLSFDGSYGPNNVVRVYGDNPGASFMTINAPIITHRVKVVDEGIDRSYQFMPAPYDATTIVTPEFQHRFLRPTFGDPVQPGAYPLFPPSTDHFADGHEVTIAHNDPGARDCVLMYENRLPIWLDRRITVRCNKIRGIWEVVEAPLPLLRYGTVTATDIPAGAEADPAGYVIPAVGCRPNMIATAASSGAISSFVVTDVRPEVDQVRLWLRNRGAATESLTTQFYIEIRGVEPPAYL